MKIKAGEWVGEGNYISMIIEDATDQKLWDKFFAMIGHDQKQFTVHGFGTQGPIVTIELIKD